MKGTRMANFLRGIILIGVAFAFLSSFEWFRSLLRNLFIGTICVVVLLLVWFGYKKYKEVRNR